MDGREKTVLSSAKKIVNKEQLKLVWDLQLIVIASFIVDLARAIAFNDT